MGLKYLSIQVLLCSEFWGTSDAQREGFAGRRGRAMGNGRSFNAFDRAVTALAAMCSPALYRSDLTDCWLLEKSHEWALCG